MGGRFEEGPTDAALWINAMTNGIGLRIFCLGVKGTWAARRKIIDCLSRPFSTDLELGVPGVIYPSGLAIGKRSINVSAGGRRAGFSRASSNCWPAITTMNT